jgi:uncharacterized protein
MQSDLYNFSAPLFVRHLNILSEVLLIAEKHATEHSITPAALLSARLYPDMFPLTGQVRAACDTAQRTTARILGKDPPSTEDADKTFGEMQERIQKASAYVGGHPAETFRAAEQRIVDFPQGKETVKLTTREYLTRFALPNFYFHVTTAYDILRHNGVILGKRNFLGAISGA